MAIIIGAATKVYFNGLIGDGSGEYCVTSANWGFAPNTQRFYCIGSWDPFILLHKPVETLSVTLYAPGPIVSILPTLGCSDAETQISASVIPVACFTTSEEIPPLTGEWHVTSYNYSKDESGMPGQETWSLQRWTNLQSVSVFDLPTNEIAYPTFIMRGISEGQGTLNSGLVFGDDVIRSYTGSVSAGSFGRADILYTGTVTAVGGGSSAAGEIGQGSASVTLNPMYF